VYKWSAAQFSLQRPEFATMFCTVHLDDASASDVVALTGIPKNSVSRAVAKLMEEGMLKREPHELDGRKSVLRLTKKGRKVYDELLPKFVARQERMLAVLSAPELKEFDRLLNKLVERDDDWATDF
jgi:MarR family transcriptional regulator, temperature-dependent positive regulator of motility